MKKRIIDYIVDNMNFDIIKGEVQQEEIAYMEIVDLIGWKMLDNDKKPIELDISEIRELVVSKLDYCISKVAGNFNYVSLAEYGSQELGGVKYMYIFSKEKLSDEAHFPLFYMAYLSCEFVIKNKCIKLYKEYWS